MGLFHKKEAKQENHLTNFRIYMTPDGKIGENSKPTVVEIKEDCEFNAVWTAERQKTNLKVAKVEKA